MFERYTEQARRALFFARFEASQLGSISIETEHLLLGLIREATGLSGRILAESQVSLENIRKDIEHLKRLGERLARMEPDRLNAGPLLDQVSSSLDRLRKRLAV